MDAAIEALRVRLGVMETEVQGLRDAKHEHAGLIGALTTLEKVAAEQRSQLIKDVAELSADVRSGFREVRNDMDAELAQRDQGAWRRLTFTVSAGAALGALAVQVAHGI